MYLLNPCIAEEVRRVAESHRSPFYLYDRSEIRRIATQFLNLPWDAKSVHFATMANDSPEFLRAVRAAGLQVFVNSIPHLDRAKAVGFSGEEIIFTASAMDDETMRRAHGEGALVNLDSLGQIETWQKVCPGQPAGLRCNLGELVTPKATRAGYFLGRESRLGLTLGEIESLKGAGWVEGLHLYVGTDILDLSHFHECYLELARLAPLFPNLRYLDFGGGFGVPRSQDVAFDFLTYGQLIKDIMASASASAGRTLRLILEPGRIVGAEAGHFACRVVDVKSRFGRQLVGVNASAAQFPRPLFYPDNAFHPVAMLPGDRRDTNCARKKTDIFGCSTYSRDFLALDQELPVIQPGDLMVLGHAGAYCASAHTAFLGFPRPEEFYV